MVNSYNICMMKWSQYSHWTWLCLSKRGIATMSCKMPGRSWLVWATSFIDELSFVRLCVSNIYFRLLCCSKFKPMMKVSIYCFCITCYLYSLSISHVLQAFEKGVGPKKICIKRMGELDFKAFRVACSKRLSEEDEQGIAILCSKWQDEIKNPRWHPFQFKVVDGKEVVRPLITCNCYEVADHERAFQWAPCRCPESGCGVSAATARLATHLAAGHGWPVTDVSYARAHRAQDPPAARRRG